MFTLKHLSLLFVIIVSTEVYAQFDTVVFSKEGYFSYESIMYMGDQNNDGYDDFVLSILSLIRQHWPVLPHFFTEAIQYRMILYFRFHFKHPGQLLRVTGTGMVTEIL
jgi:hypothetical protein